MVFLVHQEGNILDVVVLVVGDDVEGHAAEFLLDGIKGVGLTPLRCQPGIDHPDEHRSSAIEESPPLCKGG